MTDKDPASISRTPARWSPVKLILIVFLVTLFLFFIIDSFTKKYSLGLVSELVASLTHLNVVIMTILFVVITAISVIFCFPTGAMCLSGGYLFCVKFGFTIGFFASTITILLGNSLGCAITYKIAIWVSTTDNQMLAKEDFHPLLWGIRKAIEKKGRTINTLLRLTPIIPGAVLNYCLPLLGTKFEDFIFGSFIGTSPYAFLLSVLGSMLGDSSAMERFILTTPLWITIPMVMVAASSLTLGAYLIYKYSKEALHAAMEEDKALSRGDKSDEGVALLDELKHAV
jgi:uncharacterized membrane protein YdjX (TVP38/TMEM64 family)